MKAGRPVLAFIAALAVAVAGAYAAWRHWPILQSKQTVKRVLLDPESAQFDEVRYARRTNGSCGMVNAKNRMGGYTGFTAFVVTSDGRVVFGPNEEDETLPPTATAEQRTRNIQRSVEIAEKRLEFARLVAQHCPADGEEPYRPPKD